MIQSTQLPVVQKFGGSSLSTPEKVRRVARKIAASAADGRPTVVVVSAMGDTTSNLIEKALEFSPTPPSRELDMLLSAGERMSAALLAMTLEEIGSPAISLSGPQCGILTDANHSSAEILDVRPGRILEELGAGRVVVVAGFQGISAAGEITTLGRGGSDTTAVALAGALGADRCEIYSDVAGVYTADPRIVDEAAHVERIDAELMGEYSLRGARVLHPSSIEFARRDGVAIHAHSTFGDDRIFTRIMVDADLALTERETSDLPVVGVTSRKHCLRLHGLDHGRERVAEVLEGLDGQDAVLHDGDDVLVDIADVADPDHVTEVLRERFDDAADITESLASVSIVGKGLGDDLAERMTKNLTGAGVDPVSTYRTPNSITCAVPPEHREDAVRALHAEFVESEMTVGA